MAKPRRIILVRHGESEGNRDSSVYDVVPDHKIDLTKRGAIQAKSAGKKIHKMIGKCFRDDNPHGNPNHKNSAVVYMSPYTRTRRTYDYMMTSDLGDNVLYSHEDPRLREQEWGNLTSRENINRIISEREKFGLFYYRIPNGESGADVYDRMSTFIETLHRDFDKLDYPENAIIVTHGLALRLFLMRWFHWSVEKFEKTSNPKNCEFVVMEADRGKYKLVEDVK